jgi:hypothetical protein
MKMEKYTLGKFGSIGKVVAFTTKKKSVPTAYIFASNIMDQEKIKHAEKGKEAVEPNES